MPGKRGPRFHCAGFPLPALETVKKNYNPAQSFRRALFREGKRAQIGAAGNDGELFLELANQGVGGRFSALHLAAGKLPQAPMLFVPRSAMDQNAAIPTAQDRRDDAKPCRIFFQLTAPSQDILKTSHRNPALISLARLFGGLSMFRFLANLRRDDKGATAVEYGLILALVFLAMLGGISAFGQNAIGMWNRISTNVSGSA